MLKCMLLMRAVLKVKMVIQTHKQKNISIQQKPGGLSIVDFSRFTISAFGCVLLSGSASFVMMT